MGPPESPTEAIGRFEWERIVRRVRMGSANRNVALTLATYGNLDGTRVHPGVDRLSLVMEVSPKTVKRGLAWLREMGFIFRVKQGNRWAHEADEYRLTIPGNLWEIPMLSPDEKECPGVTDDPQTLSPIPVDNEVQGS